MLPTDSSVNGLHWAQPTELRGLHFSPYTEFDPRKEIQYKLCLVQILHCRGTWTLEEDVIWSLIGESIRPRKWDLNDVMSLSTKFLKVDFLEFCHGCWWFQASIHIMAGSVAIQVLSQRNLWANSRSGTNGSMVMVWIMREHQKSRKGGGIKQR